MRIFPNILHYPFLHYLCRDSSLSLSMSRPVSTKEGPPGGEILALDAPTDQLVPLRRSAPKKKSSGGRSVSPTFIDLGGPSEMQLAADAEDFPEVSERAVQALAELEAQSQSRDDGVQQKMDSFEEV